MVRIYIVLFLFLFSNLSYAFQCQALNTNSKIVLSNGMNTEDIRIAQINARKIIAKVKKLHKQNI